MSPHSPDGASWPRGYCRSRTTVSACVDATVRAPSCIVHLKSKCLLKRLHAGRPSHQRGSRSAVTVPVRMAVDYDNFYLDPDLADSYVAVLRGIAERYYESVTRFTTTPQTGPT